MLMRQDYKQKYTKYKHQYMILKGGDNIRRRNKYNIEIINDLNKNEKNKNKINKDIYITTYDNCDKAIKLFDKVIILTDKNNYNPKFELCSIICENVLELIDY